MTSTRAMLLAVAAGILFAPSKARAERAHEIDLHWTAPEGCPSDAEIARRVLATIGPGSRAAVTARIDVTKTDRAWQAQIHLAEQTDRRAVEGESCEAVGDAVAVIVALAAQDTTPVPEPAPEPAEKTTPAPSVGRTGELFVGLGIGSHLGILPSAALEPSLIVGWATKHASVNVELGITTVAKGRTSGRPEEGASFWSLRGGLRACYAFADVFGPCVGFEAARLAANGFGSTRPAEAVAVVPVAYGGLLARLRISSAFSARGTLDGLVPFERASFSVEGTGLVHRLSAIGLRGAAGIEVHF